MIRKIYVTVTSLLFVLLSWNALKILLSWNSSAFGILGARMPLGVALILILAITSMITWIVLHWQELLSANEKTISFTKDLTQKTVSTVNEKLNEKKKSDELEKDESESSTPNS